MNDDNTYIDKLIRFLKWRKPSNNQKQPTNEQESILFEWYKSMCVYKFSSTLPSDFSSLRKGSIRDIASVISLLPFTCVFVADKLVMYESPYDQIVALGFWAATNLEKPLCELKLMFFLDPGDTYIIKIPLDAKLTLKQCIALGRGNIEATSRGGRISNEEYAKQFEAVVDASLQRLCFICSQNAIVDFSDEKSRSISRNIQAENNVGVWNVSVRYAHDVTIQVPINDDVDESDSLEDRLSNNSVEKTRSRPRPHVRRAHWRRCWMGSRSDGTGRKMVIKWIPQASINKKSDTDMPIVIHKYKET